MKHKEKELFVSQLVEKLKGQENFIFAGFQGTDSEKINKIRNTLRPLSWECRVTKNRLYQRVFRNLGLGNEIVTSLEKFFQGPTLLVFERHQEDKKNKKEFGEELSALAAVARVLLSFSQEHPNFKINGGLNGEQLLSSTDLLNLAKLPSKKVLLQQTIRQMKSPLIRMLKTVRRPLESLVYILNTQSKRDKLI